MSGPTGDERLWHGVPRLDAPDRIWLLPTPVAGWLAAGLFSGPLAAQVLTLIGRHDPAAVWAGWPVWLIWALGLLLGSLGAWLRPGGLHIGHWAQVLAEYCLVPRRAVWTPVGHGLWWW